MKKINDLFQAKIAANEFFLLPWIQKETVRKTLQGAYLVVMKAMEPEGEGEAILRLDVICNKSTTNILRSSTADNGMQVSLLK